MDLWSYICISNKVVHFLLIFELKQTKISSAFGLHWLQIYQKVDYFSISKSICEEAWFESDNTTFQTRKSALIQHFNVPGIFFSFWITLMTRRSVERRPRLAVKLTMMRMMNKLRTETANPETTRKRKRRNRKDKAKGQFLSCTWDR